jgi:hypothetical protein
MARVKDLIKALSFVPVDWHYTVISRDYWALHNDKEKLDREQLGYVDLKNGEVGIYELDGNVRIVTPDP